MVGARGQGQLSAERQVAAHFALHADVPRVTTDASELASRC